MFYELHLMIRTENRAHRSRKLLLEIELVFARGGDKYNFMTEIPETRCLCKFSFVAKNT